MICEVSQRRLSVLAGPCQDLTEVAARAPSNSLKWLGRPVSYAMGLLIKCNKCMLQRHIHFQRCMAASVVLAEGGYERRLILVIHRRNRGNARQTYQEQHLWQHAGSRRRQLRATELSSGKSAMTAAVAICLTCEGTCPLSMPVDRLR